MSWLTTEGAARQIGDGQTIVGSGPAAGWRLVAHDLATRHFIIASDGQRVTICAATVETVVAVNGRQITTKPVVLQDGDTIDAGSVRFAFSSSKGASIPQLAVPPAHLVESRGGIVHPLDEPSVGIGRDRSNPIVVRDPTASRFHAEVRREAGGYVLHPRGSSGTLINGRRTGSPERLQEGDRIEIANVEMRFVASAAPPDAPRPAPRTSNADASQRRTLVQTAIHEIPRVGSGQSTAWIWIVVAILVVGVAFLASR
jgi:predicted component of type VI protein secretion system